MIPFTYSIGSVYIFYWFCLYILLIMWKINYIVVRRFSSSKSIKFNYRIHY